MKTMDVSPYTNSELEEMGVGFCICPTPTVEHDDHEKAHVVCEDCGASSPLGVRGDRLC